MKDAAKLIVYFAAVVAAGAIVAAPLFWGATALSKNGMLPFLTRFNFESFFHRALLLCAVLFLWPLLRSLHIRSWRDLQIQKDPRYLRHILAGALLAILPLGCAAVILIHSKVLLLKTAVSWAALGGVAAAAVAVPLIEEFFFRGLILGVLLRSCRPIIAVVLSAAFFAILHFLKAPNHTNTVVTWQSGWKSIARAFAQFADPLLVVAGFATLFLLGCILADARLRTRSLWLAMGLHGGWIFVAGVIGKVTNRTGEMLPWLGQNLLVGLIPLSLALFTWGLLLIFNPRRDGKAI